MQPTVPAPARPDVAAGALRILVLQTSVGNAATSRLLQRDPVGGLATPESPIHPQQEREPGWSVNQYEGDDQVSLPKEQAEALPPDVARKVLAAQATLGKMMPLEPKKRAVLGKALAGSRIAELVTLREQYRDGIKTTEAQIGSLMPPAGQPDDSVAYQIHSLGQFLETQRLKVEEFQVGIDEEVRRSGCATEDELLTLVKEDFPKLFMERGKLIANQQLVDNQLLIETEMARYGITENPLAGTIHEEAEGGVDPYVVKTAKKEEAEGLRTAAKELLGLRQARETAEGNRKYFSHMEDEWEAAQNAPPGTDFDGSQAVRDATEAEQLAFDRLVLQFPMLYRVDIEKVAKSSDEELTQEVYGKALELLGNIADTRSNLWDGKLEVWNLKDIVELTLIDLAIPEGSPLIAVVDNYVKEAKADSGILSKALRALQIAAAVVAIIASGGTALIAAGIGAAISVSQLVSASKDYSMEKAASNVALDPSVADISKNEPQLMPVVFAVLSLGLDAVGVGQALKALRAPARALLESGDLAAFSATAYKALPAAEAAHRRREHSGPRARGSCRSAGARSCAVRPRSPSACRARRPLARERPGGSGGGQRRRAQPRSSRRRRSPRCAGPGAIRPTGSGRAPASTTTSSSSAADRAAWRSPTDCGAKASAASTSSIRRRRARPASGARSRACISCARRRRSPGLELGNPRSASAPGTKR